MGCVDALKSMGKSSFVESISYIATIALAASSISTCYVSTGVPVIIVDDDNPDSSADYSSITANWQTAPVYVVEVTGSSSCPTGYNSMPYITWPGAGAGNCACPSGAVYKGQSYTSSYNQCNTNQTGAGCLQDPAISAVELMYWKGKRLCYKRGGQPAATFDPLYVRPKPEKGACPTGYKVCGNGTYDGNRAFCFPTGLRCPITALKSASTSPGVNMTVYNISSGFNDGTKLYYSRFFKGLLPVVDLQMAFTKSLSTGSVGGPCYFSSTKQNGYSGQTTWGSSLNAMSFNYPSSCKKYDTRFTAFDTTSEYNLLLENFNNITSCSKYNLKTTNLDYRNGGSSCSGTDCALGTQAASLTCKSGDSICMAAKYQSVCGKYQHVATQALSASRTIGMFERREIFWKTDCYMSEWGVKTAVVPLKKAVGAQLGLLVINIITNILVGILLPLLLLYNLCCGDIPCCPGRGSDEKKLLKRAKGFGASLSQLAKIAPLIITIIIANKLVNTFTKLSKGMCSDAVTNYTISYLGDTLPKVRQDNLKTLAIDMAQLLAALVAPIMAKLSKKKQEQTVAITGAGDMTVQPPYHQGPSPMGSPYPVPVSPPYSPAMGPPGGYACPPYYPQQPQQPFMPQQQQQQQQHYMPQQPQQQYMPQPQQQYTPQPQQQYMPQPPQQYMAPPNQRCMVVFIPQGAQAGQVIKCKSVEGTDVTYTVPPGAVPGQTLQVAYFV